MDGSGFRLSSESQQSLVFGNHWDASRRLTQETQVSQTFPTLSQPMLAPLPSRPTAGRAVSEELLQSIRHKEVLAAIEAVRGDLREESERRAGLAARVEQLAATVHRLETLMLRLKPREELAAEGSAATDSSLDGLSPSEPMTVNEYLRWRTERAPVSQSTGQRSPADLLFS